MKMMTGEKKKTARKRAEGKRERKRNQSGKYKVQPAVREEEQDFGEEKEKRRT